MSHPSTVLLYGNDNRIKELESKFLPYEVTVLHAEQIDMQAVKKDTLVLGGNLPTYITQYCKQHQIEYFDYLKDPVLVRLNTIATAEGAICEAIRLSPLNIGNANCLVLGFGRCAKTLANRLQGLCGKVTILCRNPMSQAEAVTLGFEKFDSPNDLSKYEFVFNTIPAPIINREMIDTLSEEVTIIDIASKPGGCDFSYCQSVGKRAYLCPGLPGIYAPKSSAEMIFSHIYKIYEWNRKETSNESHQ